MPASVPPPYEGDLLRIAEIMGALHYLRPLCGASEGQRWRNEMQALIEAEAPTEDRKETLTRGFNNGYVAFERSYRTCTPAANLAVQRYLTEGSKLAHDIVARYGN
ncbi:TIGR02301 family protein [Blastochloris sulfoviridis]|uniref:TIGR02301 family protein n=2 Tax=Blastochloris sulfoviridis TaxID=50712 RepID=A0A5M6HWW0_9HYPH|nr:TIGR02301 family protein [Blastochloris sulfoviridis]